MRFHNGGGSRASLEDTPHTGKPPRHHGEGLPPREGVADHHQLRHPARRLGADPVPAVVAIRLPKHERDALQVELAELVVVCKEAAFWAADELRTRNRASHAASRGA